MILLATFIDYINKQLTRFYSVFVTLGIKLFFKKFILISKNRDNVIRVIINSTGIEYKPFSKLLNQEAEWP